jgi:molybdenum cofactor cytidylyltransferase
MQLSHALRIHRKEVVVLVGGGGKTTLMFRLADELAASGRRVVTTMTTRIFVGQMDRAPARLVTEDEDALLASLPRALETHRHVIVAGEVIVEQDKVQGVPPALLDRITLVPEVDAMIIEADGSRRLPFKAPASHEPVIPTSATVIVPIVGLDVLGQPLDTEHVHRPQIVAELTGATIGDLITPAMIAAVLAHPQGGAKDVPPNARLIPFLNKVEDEATLAAAREIARLLLQQPRIDSVRIGAAQRDDPVREVWGRCGAVVLAAGEAKRFGALKQMLPWRGIPLVAHVADQALRCLDVDRVAVTVGAEAEQVSAALAGHNVSVVPVAGWSEGQSRSVKAGLQALVPRSAVLFLLADQPGVSPELLTALIQRHRETLAPVVAPRHAGQRGNPVLFDQATFAEFDQLEGDIGARPIIQAHRDQIAWVDWPTPEILEDIDVASDYKSSAQG